MPLSMVLQEIIIPLEYPALGYTLLTKWMELERGDQADRNETLA
jgi:hypothetical protein